jgi:hypothetical protein
MSPAVPLAYADWGFEEIYPRLRDLKLHTRHNYWAW